MRNEIPKYFQFRDNLISVFIFTDIRHPMREADLHMVQMLIELKLPFKVVLTKADKVSEKKRIETESFFKKKYIDVISLSTKNKESIINFRIYIVNCF